MFRTAGRFSAFLFLVVGSAASAQEGEPQILAAGGIAPSIGIVDGLKDGKLIFRQTQFLAVQRTVMQTVTETVVVEGRQQQRTKSVPTTVTQLKPVTNKVPHDLADVRVFDTDGKPIPPEGFAELFAKPRIVLFANVRGFAGPQAVDPTYLKIARKGTPFVAFIARPQIPSHALPTTPNVLPGLAPAPATLPPPATAPAPVAVPTPAAPAVAPPPTPTPDSAEKPDGGTR